MPAPVCADELSRLYTVITQLMEGKAVVTIGFGERQVSYEKANLDALRQIYGMWHRQCGAAAGLPDIAAPVQRGAPVSVRFID